MSDKYQNIQIIRIILVLLFFVHFGQRIELEWILCTITDFGVNGVYPFFIICGFVTFLSVNKKELNLKKYYLNRFIRLAPIYYVSA